MANPCLAAHGCNSTAVICSTTYMHCPYGALRSHSFRDFLLCKVSVACHHVGDINRATAHEPQDACTDLMCFDMQVKPSVLHGDLWSGNISGVEGKPSIFDPAVYYGHSEADFGMSWCAGFSSAFYDAYFRVLPKAPGQCLCPVFALCSVQTLTAPLSNQALTYRLVAAFSWWYILACIVTVLHAYFAGFENRKQLYLLYHYLNHYNLFGGGYYSSAEGILRNLTSKI